MQAAGNLRAMRRKKKHGCFRVKVNRREGTRNSFELYVVSGKPCH
jgi:hypothetical protein